MRDRVGGRRGRTRGTRVGTGMTDKSGRRSLSDPGGLSQLMGGPSLGTGSTWSEVHFRFRSGTVGSGDSRETEVEE